LTVPDALQRGIALVLGVLTAPLVAALAIAIRADSPGGALYIARRVGEHGRTFGLLKLRTMQLGADRGPGVSAAADPRVTRVGRVLRRTRLDELPQLWNVVRGDMRLVGPRPEDPRFVDPDDPMHRRVFAARPGITGITQLLHTDEAAQVDPSDPDASYRTAVLPIKVVLDAAYLRRRSFALDAWILWRTAVLVAGRPPSQADVTARLGMRVLPPGLPPD
jgi:lipopolysaccharide/colanic/teichoic acid biosynthesis glycosyltransferase